MWRYWIKMLLSIDIKINFFKKWWKSNKNLLGQNFLKVYFKLLLEMLMSKIANSQWKNAWGI